MAYVYIFQALLGIIALFLASMMGWNYFLQRSSFYQKLQEHKKIKLLDKSSFGRTQVYYLSIEDEKLVLSVSAKGEVALVRIQSGSSVNQSQEFLEAIMRSDISGSLNDSSHDITIKETKQALDNIGKTFDIKGKKCGSDEMVA